MSEQQALLDYINKHLIKNNHKISSKTLLFEERHIDSMNILLLIGYIEKRLNRRLSDEEVVMKNFRSVEAIAKVFFHEK